VRRVILALAVLVSGVAGAEAKDTVCDKWRPPFGELSDLRKCEAERAEAKKSVWDWLAKYGVRTQAELDDAVQQRREFAVVAHRCFEREDMSAASDMTTVVRCLHEYRDPQPMYDQLADACRRLTADDLSQLTKEQIAQAFCNVLSAVTRLPSGSPQRLECAEAEQVFVKEGNTRGMPLAALCGAD
jgi:hypothetical protein